MKPILRLFVVVLLSTVVPLSLFAQQQEQTDSLVRLLNADFMQSMEIRGVTWRKVLGKPARFLHNDTYLMCDSAMWNVDTKIIEAFDNVKILQDRTVLTSDRMVYRIDDDLAEFRGDLVQLTDKDNNTLRTNFLDYNTKDSTAIFLHGGAMRDKDGQIIESLQGNYDSKIKTFEFHDDVNMFTDSVFVKTTYLRYESDRSLATFGAETNAWKDEYMLSCDAGWYDRDKELFLFRIGVHVMSDTREGWCDTLYVERLSSNVTMLGNAQITDSTRHATAMAGKIDYCDSLSRIIMTREPAIIAQTTSDTDKEMKDTVYLSADSLHYVTVSEFDIPSAEKAKADQRIKSVNADPVAQYRKTAAEAAAKAEAEANADDPNNPENARKKALKNASGKTAPGGGNPAGHQHSSSSQLPEGTSAEFPTDAPVDSVAFKNFRQDSLQNRDTAKVGFMNAVGSIKMLRGQMQAVCDSLFYCDIDSTACLFRNPIVWNEGSHQYNSDSMYVVIKNSAMEKASLMSNAFIHIEQDTSHYDQIRGAEMTAFFDKKGKLSRFDALGGASALFYLEENNILATVNKSEAKMLSAAFKGGNIQKIYYYDAPKSNAYPVVQLGREETRLKGFMWEPQKRPATPEDVTKRVPRGLQRSYYSTVSKAAFVQTDNYFPGYMDGVYQRMAFRDSMKVVREQQRKEQERIADSLAVADSLFRRDSLFRADSLMKAFKADSIARADSIAKAKADSLAAIAPLVPEIKDTAASVPVPPQKSEAEIARERADSIKAAKALAKLQAKQNKEEERNNKWKARDDADAAKAEAKKQAQLEKLRKEKLKELIASRKREEKEAAILDKYTRRYARQKSRMTVVKQGSPKKVSMKKAKVSGPGEQGDDVQDNL